MYGPYSIGSEHFGATQATQSISNIAVMGAKMFNIFFRKKARKKAQHRVSQLAIDKSTATEKPKPRISDYRAALSNELLHIPPLRDRQETAVIAH
ncbi:MAG: hypothetical protein ACPGRD_01490 [Planktomarina sp.]